jgi:hypothetical protein
MARSNEWRKILRGILLLIGLHGIAGLIAIAIGLSIYALVTTIPTQSDNQSFFILLNGYTSLIFMVIGIGVFQLFYVIPVLLILWIDRRYAIAQGIAIGALLTLLLNVAGIALFLSWTPR